MATVQFDRDRMARRYVSLNRDLDPGIRKILYLPKDAPDREIRILVVNDLLAEMNDALLQPVVFGFNLESEEEHRLLMLDVTPSQWEAINRGEIPLPEGWTLEQADDFDPEPAR
ncbi:hypothetical protein [Paludisphaera sp.]|uniref:hypothetical protein n=1 Tax=Paludisphaera sp. TaxID=2017432 RepID=UPI00301C9FD6